MNILAMTKTTPDVNLRVKNPGVPIAARCASSSSGSDADIVDCSCIVGWTTRHLANNAYAPIDQPAHLNNEQVSIWLPAVSHHIDNLLYPLLTIENYSSFLVHLR